MKHNYVIIDDDQKSILETRAIAAGFQSLLYAGAASNYEDGLNLIIKTNPAIVFLEIEPQDPVSKLSLQLINELHRYLKVVPKIIITTRSRELAFEAIKYEVFDYYIKPVQTNDLRKTIFRYEKLRERVRTFQEVSIPDPKIKKLETPEYTEIIEEQIVPSHDNAELKELSEELTESQEVTLENKKKPLIICVKSYGDYRFIEAKDICYLQADNNSTDIHLTSGEMITAFKTLKHFETVLNVPFVRIHNSYIVNIDYVSRIHTGNAICYIKNSTTAKLPFSKSYKENVDAILESISNGNYLEI